MFVRTYGLLLLALLCGAWLRAEAPRLVNLSTRGQAGSGNNVLITGFVIGPGAPKTVLIRAVGPGLSAFLPNTLADPALTLYHGATVVATNDNWNPADAATMQAVGASPLAAGSLDSALVRLLDPGTYTAIVTGTAGANNLALVEVYEVSGGTSRLLNLSTRALVGTGNNVLIAGLVVGSGGGTRHLLVRAAGPGLAAVAPQLTGVLADPILSVRDVTNAVIAGNDNWGSAGDAAVLSAAFTQAGAFPFAPGSLDSALLLDLAPGAYTILISGAGNSTGVALAEIYDVTPDTANSVSIAATKPAADESGANSGEFTLTRSGNTLLPLTVAYSVGGTATNGADYDFLSGTAVIPAGAASVTIPVTPVSDFVIEPTSTVVVTLQPGPDYTVSSASSATVTITDIPPTLYVATLQASSVSGGSTAAGTATLLLNPAGTAVSVSLNFSNLSSAETVTYVRLGNPGEIGTELFRLPDGPVDSLYWPVSPSGAYSAADILNALRTGRIFVSIETTNYPGGELRGQFVQSNGSQAFSAPPAPPVIDLSVLSDTDAARFLTQATFGPTAADIAALKQTGYSTWLATQLAQPPTLHRDATMADFSANNAGGQGAVNGVNTRPGQAHRDAAWWKIVLAGNDQLRQRVAFALSEHFVISDANGTVYNAQEGAANYYDLLARDAFGNFRTLLEDVTLSPMMGVYLSQLRNAKADPTTGAQPNENYAREVMQLFTIGLNQLQPDGTLMLDATGRPIPTYDQATVTEMARVFTGWAYANANATNANFRTSAQDYINPMTLYAGYHDTGAKTIVGGVKLPAGQTGTQDLKAALDALFNHPSTAPFISRQLIQRLVTSNPSPAYVYRVAQVFANNGAGVRGDLAAVIRAILLDYEARSPAVAASLSHGKLKEPLLRVSALLRAAGVTSATGRFAFGNTTGSLAESPLSAPTVFNFFAPGYVEPGALAAAGLVAPEYQILTATTGISTPNFLYNFIANTTYLGATLNYTDLLPLAAQPGPLTDQLNLLLAANSLPAAARDRIVATLTALPASTGTTDRIHTAAYLVVTSSWGAVQK